MSIEDAAAMVGVRRWTFGLWESGQQPPRARYQAALRRFLELAPQANRLQSGSWVGRRSVCA